MLGFAIAQDAGFAINPMSVEGQMQGGVSQGLGIALSEEMLYDDEGRLMNGNLLDYRLPTTRDLPPIEAIIVEVPSEEGPLRRAHRRRAVDRRGRGGRLERSRGRDRRPGDRSTNHPRTRPPGAWQD